ncbi:nucleoside hydrolase [Nanoarchaeota archaeon]
MNIIIDTDPGHDDAMALMLAVKSNLFNIKAITTVAGNSTIENTTRNTRYILNLLESNIPVYSGAGKPIKRDLIQAVVHGKSGLAGIDPTNEPNLTNDAPEKILEIINQNEEITIITLGPLTNIALAIQQDPETMKKVKQIVMMGGAIKVPGNRGKTAEFNIFVDPEAADIVFKFPVQKVLVPLDACNDVHLYLEDFEKVTDERLKEPLLKMNHEYIENTFQRLGIRASLMYDPLTVYYLINPDVCKTKDYNVVIETKGEHTFGQTVAEFRHFAKEEPNVKVVEHIDAETFRKDFIEILSR